MTNETLSIVRSKLGDKLNLLLACCTKDQIELFYKINTIQIKDMDIDKLESSLSLVRRTVAKNIARLELIGERNGEGFKTVLFKSQIHDHITERIELYIRAENESLSDEEIAKEAEQVIRTCGFDQCSFFELIGVVNVP